MTGMFLASLMEEVAHGWTLRDSGTVGPVWAGCRGRASALGQPATEQGTCKQEWPRHPEKQERVTHIQKTWCVLMDWNVRIFVYWTMENMPVFDAVKYLRTPQFKW